jgi:hypothetical protein
MGAMIVTSRPRSAWLVALVALAGCYVAPPEATTPPPANREPRGRPDGMVAAAPEQPDDPAVQPAPPQAPELPPPDRGPEPSTSAPTPPAPPASAPPTPRPPSAAVTGLLARQPGTGGVTFDVTILPCVKDVCPVEISARQASGKIARARTEWSVNNRAVVRSIIPVAWGAGDLLTAPGIALATGGDKERAIAIVARPVRLKGDIAGLLIDASGGENHVRRWHELWLMKANRLERVWELTDPPGSGWSSTAITRDADGDTVVAMTAVDRASTGAVDDFRVSALGWSSTGVTDRPVPPLHAVVVGGFATPEAARKALQEQPSCYGVAWVLPATRVGGPTGKIALVRPGLSKEDADRIAATIAPCAGAKRTSVKPLDK